MLFSRPLFRVCASFIISLMLAAAAAPALANPVHVTEAETLLADLSVSKQNVYGSSPSYIKWNGRASQARTVCGAFITNLLMHSYSWTTNTLTQWLGTTSPYADTYHDAILAHNNFTPIINIQNVQPGDIIAIKYNDSSVTGHTMMVDSLAKAERAQSPLVAGTTQYALTVIDSSSGHHGAADTRVTAPSTTHNGIGKGDIRVYVNASLRPVGYSWSNEPGSQYYSMAQRSLAIGRIDLAHWGVKASPPMSNGIGTITGEIVIQEEDLTSGKTDDDTLAAPQMNADSLPDADQLGGCSIAAHAGLTLRSTYMGLLLFMGLLGLRWRRRDRADGTT